MAWDPAAAARAVQATVLRETRGSNVMGRVPFPVERVWQGRLQFDGMCLEWNTVRVRIFLTP
ncbi:MAG TPA: hypothetical protein DCR20_11850 [Planctomycetaceae bacterium]|nr:hypothetical protein [Planctomycetaceae bacterium]